MKKTLLTATLAGLLSTTALAAPVPSPSEKARMAILNIGYAVGALEICGGQFSDGDHSARVQEWFMHGNLVIQSFVKVDNNESGNLLFKGRSTAHTTGMYIHWADFAATQTNTPDLVNLQPGNASQEVILARCETVNTWVKENLLTGFMSRKNLLIPKEKVRGQAS